MTPYATKLWRLCSIKVRFWNSAHLVTRNSHFFFLFLVWNEGEGGPGNYVASGYSVYEEENQHLQEGLRAKVSALKSVSVKCLHIAAG